MPQRSRARVLEEATIFNSLNMWNCLLIPDMCYGRLLFFYHILSHCREQVNLREESELNPRVYNSRKWRQESNLDTPVGDVISHNQHLNFYVKPFPLSMEIRNSSILGVNK